MVENIKDQTTESIGFIDGIFHSPDFWTKLIVGIIILAVGLIAGGFLKMLFNRRPKRLKKAFDSVELINVNDEETCKYPNLNFIKYPSVAIHLKIHRVWGLLKKLRSATGVYDKKVKDLEENVDHNVNTILDKCSDSFTPIDRTEISFPLSYIFSSHMKTGIIDAAIDKVKAESKVPRTYLEVYPSSKGYQIQVKIRNGKEYQIGRAATESEASVLKDLVQCQIDENESSALAMLKAERNMREAKEVFNKRLAVIVRNVNIRAGGVENL